MVLVEWNLRTCISRVLSASPSLSESGYTLRGIKEDYHSGLAYSLRLVRGRKVPLSKDQRPRQLEFCRVTEL